MNWTGSMANKVSHSRGFTILELLIVVAIVAILAAVAIPAYQDSAMRARRGDGVAALLKLQLEQEKFRANCRFYAGSVHKTNATVCGASAAASNINFATSSEEKHYLIAVTTASGNSYTITADPQGGQASDTACDPITYVHNSTGLSKIPVGCWD